MKRLAKDKYGSQSALADAIGKTPGQLGDWVSGRRVPGGDILILIRKVTGVSVDWLLTGEGEMYAPKSPGITPTDMSDAQDFDADRDMIIETIEEALARLRRMRVEQKEESEENDK